MNSAAYRAAYLDEREPLGWRGKADCCTLLSLAASGIWLLLLPLEPLGLVSA
ncbi:MAG: hypothetical protein ACTHKS_18640 [Gaiellaceae bacterium]